MDRNRKRRTLSVAGAILLLVAGTGYAAAQSKGSELTTAWHHGEFHVNVAGVVRRSNIILARPNVEAEEAMTLGNGRLGVAVWSADGFTAQLNRADTLPSRLSPGQVVLPGLTTLIHAADYAGKLDLYNGEFLERGGGMTAKVYIQPESDVLVIDVTGARPEARQTAQLQLWNPRMTETGIQGKIGLLSQHWIDDRNPGFSGRAFGSLSAITALGRDVSVAVQDPLTITVSFKPYPDGHFRVLVAAPHYDGNRNPIAIARAALHATSPSNHQTWWHAFWKRAGMIRITSPDGTGEYMENLRNIYLFDAAAEKGIEYPGSQAGVADMLSSVRDAHQWDPSAFWHWNLRMQVAANLGAGLPELNEPYFNLYRENLSNIEKWTRENMRGRDGICVAETMRFNGQGIEYESSWNPVSIGRDCDANFKPYYNARTLSTGAEVSLWVWRQYLATGDRGFLIRNYPLMAASARFLLAYQHSEADGMLHTSPSNAHETQWDVKDPTTDLAAARALFPITIEAAQLLGRDRELTRKLQKALPRIPPFPRTESTGPRTLLPASADAEGQDVIAASYLPAAVNRNVENIGLEPVWPYSLIGDTSPLFALAKRTYQHRLFSGNEDWSFDPIQAARLGLSDEVKAMLVKITERFQYFPNGLASWSNHHEEFYIEQIGVVADALQEALVQDYDGLIRIAPAAPEGWNMDGNVYIRGKTKVDVQVQHGEVSTVVIESGAAQQLRVRNPWPGQPIQVISADGTKVVAKTSGQILTFHGIAGKKYLIERPNAPTTTLAYGLVSGNEPATAKRLGPVQIGLFHDRD